MNQFRTLRLLFIWMVFCGIVPAFYSGFTSICMAESSVKTEIFTEKEAEPVLENESAIYAAIDTSSQMVYVFLQRQLWSYDLEKTDWELEAEFDSMPAPQDRLEFGLNPENGALFFWSSGVGEVYRVNIEEKDITRIDRSFNHKNQFGHIPFFRNGSIHAFGGYGFWLYKNYITYFNSEIREWMLHAVSTNSPLPDARGANTGFYDPKEDAFYMFGGTYSEGNRPDDKYVNKNTSEDLWKFEFESEQWEYITDLSFDGWSYEYPGNGFNVGKVNRLSTSVYSPVSNNYYIPFSRKEGTDVMFHLAAFNTKSHKIFEPTEIPVNYNQTVIYSNYLYNPKKEEFVFIGKMHLTNQRKYPVKVITLPEDSMLAVMSKQEPGIARIALGLSFGGILIIAFILMLRYRNSESTSVQETDNNQRDKITEILTGLSEHEKNILQVLYGNEGFMESHELEVETWPDITNYDYRRKLRNETIKSLNEKFKGEIDGEEAICRRKDPNDNRRFLYGLNERISDSWNQVHKS